MSKDVPHSIGVFDSGIGGLTAVRALQQLLPTVPIIYLGDTARLPYGTKSDDTIVRYVEEGIRYLLRHYPIAALLIACNTASAVAAPKLRQWLSIPIFDVIAPAAAEAVRLSQNRRILITGTYATIESKAYERAIAQLDPRVQTFSTPCPLFVPLAEEGLADHPLAIAAAHLYLEPFTKAAIDTLILGCTHFPLLTAAIQQVVPQMQIVNSGAAAARALARSWDAPLPNGQQHGTLHILLTDVPRQFPKIAERFLGRPITSLQVVSDLARERQYVVPS